MCDVTDAEQITGFVDGAAAELGGLDILVNNAGRATPGTFATITDEQMAGDYDVKVFSIMRCTRAAVPHMRERGGGRDRQHQRRVRQVPRPRRSSPPP